MERVLLHRRSAPFGDKLQRLFDSRRLDGFRYGHHFCPIVLDGHPAALERHRVTLFRVHHWPSGHDAHRIRAPVWRRQVGRVQPPLVRRQTLRIDVQFIQLGM